MIDIRTGRGMKRLHGKLLLSYATTSFASLIALLIFLEVSFRLHATLCFYHFLMCYQPCSTRWPLPSYQALTIRRLLPRRFRNFLLHHIAKAYPAAASPLRIIVKPALPLPLANLQVVDRPNTESDGQDDAAETENQDWRIAAIQRGADTITDLLGVAATRSTALRTTEPRPLLFEVHAGTFGLLNISRRKMRRKEISDEPHVAKCDVGKRQVKVMLI